MNQDKFKGIVTESFGNKYVVRDEEGKMYECKLKGNFRIKNIKHTNPIAVGDRVEFIYNESSDYGLIFSIEERKNYIIRKSVKLSKQNHIIASNIDVAFILVTLSEPETPSEFIDRFLVTAEAYHIKPIILFHKSDNLKGNMGLEEETLFLKEIYEDIGYQCIFTSIFDTESMDNVKGIIKDKTCLFFGNSGTGKSSILLHLDPSLNLKTSGVSDQHKLGKHTTTYAKMYELSSGGFIIDSPGVKGFGITEMEKEDFKNYFPEMKKLSEKCKFSNCLHIEEPNCEIKNQLGISVSEIRYYNYISMLENNDLLSHR